MSDRTRKAIWDKCRPSSSDGETEWWQVPEDDALDLAVERITELEAENARLRRERDEERAERTEERT